MYSISKNFKKGHNGYSKKRGRKDGEAKDFTEANSDEEGDRERPILNSVHSGSIPINVVKESEDWVRRRVHSIQPPKGKFAICIGYLGTNYQGLQINPGAKSIESILERALLLAGGIDEFNYGNPQKISWTRAARTDKGVHAIANCCAMKLRMPHLGEATFVNDLNSFLPQEVRVFAASKTTKSFNAKNMCTKRRYEYLLPTYSLAAAEGTNALLLERRALQGAMVDVARQGGYAEPGSREFLGAAALERVREQLRGFRIEEAALAVLRATWKRFQGTHNFHNFTSDKAAHEASANRYILDCSCSDPFEGKDGVEYVHLVVLGQSFLLNQIRKMVGVTVDVVRGVCNAEALTTCLSPKMKVNIPMAPGVGLYLGELFFEGYNEKLHRDATFALSKKARVEPDGAVTGDDSTVTPVAGGEAVSREDAGAGKGKGEGEDAEGGEDDSSFSRAQRLCWAENEAHRQNIERFRKDVLWPHIFEQEGQSLPYLYYLDFLRITNHNYVGKNNS